MKQSVKYRILTIPTKLTVDLRIVVDNRSVEYTSMFEGNKSTNITCFPMVGISLTRPSGIDENGQSIKVPWNSNDSIALTKYNLPIFIDELASIKKDMMIPELYTYHGKRLELNETLAEKVRRVFTVGNTVVELSAVVIVKPEDESRIEGIKMKFNNEQSSVLLTLNEINSFLSNLENLNVDVLTMLLYMTYIKSPSKPTSFDTGTLMSTPAVDIKSKEPIFASESDDI